MKVSYPRYSRSLIYVLIVVIVMLIGLWMGCNSPKESPVEPIEPQVKISLGKANKRVMEVINIQNQHSKKFMSIPGVIGTATGLTEDGEIAIRIFAAQPGISGIPKNVSGVPVDIKVTGLFTPLSNPTVRFPRPVPIGASTGHPDITAGTIGCRVKDNQGNVYALSNNHVYANCNDASIGDNVLQPGPYDGGQEPDDVIGQLFDFEPILFDGSNNTIDAAIVVSSSDSLGIATPSDGYGIPDSITVAAFIGQKVQKYGRTTGWTYGEISEINVTVNVCYECGDPFCWTCSKQATFMDQIAISPGDFSGGGDSGSLVVTDDGNKNPVGLLFASSPARTLINPIDAVLQRFNVSIDAGNLGNNSPPNADFSFITSNLTSTFVDQSTDSDGTILEWSWDFGDDVTSTEQNPIHTYLTNGTYIAALTVIDDDGAMSSVSKNVTIGEPENVPPIADFAHTTSRLTTTFTDNSTDSDGTVVSWNWEFGDGTTSTSQNPIHTYSTFNTYSVVLTITDDDGATGTISKNIFVDDSGSNKPPVADFTYSTNELTVFYTDQSTDSGGTIIGWNWNFGDGQSSPIKNPMHIYSTSGTYMVTLTVTDNDLATNSFSQEVIVSEASNDPPTADFTYTASDLTVTFADQSTDADGTIIEWNWNFGDGQSSLLMNPAHIYSASGTYTVILTVTDNEGATGITSKAVTVSDETNDPPTADFTYTASDLTATFTDQSIDTDGTIIGWNWNFGDGQSSPIKNPMHIYSTSGTYMVILTVTDNNGAINSISQEITLNSSTNSPPTADFTYITSGPIAFFTDQSTDSDGTIISWQWNFGDGTSSPIKSPLHFYVISGTYLVALTVTDNTLATHSFAQEVTIN